MGRPKSRVRSSQAKGIASFLEVIAEGEVAEHLEEGVMPRSIADVVEVVVLAAGADALLAGGGADVIALLEAGEDVLELDHAGVGEHQRRVVARHQRRASGPPGGLPREIVEEGGADVVEAGHVGVRRGPGSTRGARRRRSIGSVSAPERRSPSAAPGPLTSGIRVVQSMHIACTLHAPGFGRRERVNAAERCDRNRPAARRKSAPERGRGFAGGRCGVLGCRGPQGSECDGWG